MIEVHAPMMGVTKKLWVNLLRVLYKIIIISLLNILLFICTL